MSEPTKAEADEIFRQCVLRARRMTPDEKIAEGFRLFELECEKMREEIRSEHPTANATEVNEILRQRLKRQKEIEEEGIYFDLPPEAEF